MTSGRPQERCTECGSVECRAAFEDLAIRTPGGGPGMRVHMSSEFVEAVEGWAEEVWGHWREHQPFARRCVESAAGKRG